MSYAFQHKVRLLTRDISVSVMQNVKATSFSSTLPDYNTVLRAPFREWAENALPSEHDKAHGIRWRH